MRDIFGFETPAAAEFGAINTIEAYELAVGDDKRVAVTISRPVRLINEVIGDESARGGKCKAGDEEFFPPVDGFLLRHTLSV